MKPGFEIGSLTRICVINPDVRGMGNLGEELSLTLHLSCLNSKKKKAEDWCDLINKVYLYIHIQRKKSSI